ncbi:GIY-YIG nuclease family protein [Rosistilla oblonga]|uniref:GIY-YIG nuclease family protein n=1 Tax=Rosistilla oblonga TaxID=2527990 RepID=UPI003A98612A
MSKSPPISNPSNDAEPPRDQPPWFVYILRCGDGSFYTGITKDIDRRLKQHNAGKASRYTRSRLPVEIIYREVQPDQSAALKRELAIKALSRPAKQSLIASDSNRLGEAKSAG